MQEVFEKIIEKLWILCSDRMPEKIGTVWVSFSSSLIDYVRKAYWDYDYCSSEMCFKWENGKRMKTMPVAWKPYYTPEPYHTKGEKKKKTTDILDNPELLEVE